MGASKYCCGALQPDVACNGCCCSFARAARYLSPRPPRGQQRVCRAHTLPPAPADSADGRCLRWLPPPSASAAAPPAGRALPLPRLGAAAASCRPPLAAAPAVCRRRWLAARATGWPLPPPVPPLLLPTGCGCRFSPPPVYRRRLAAADEWLPPPVPPAAGSPQPPPVSCCRRPAAAAAAGCLPSPRPALCCPLPAICTVGSSLPAADPLPPSVADRQRPPPAAPPPPAAGHLPPPLLPLPVADPRRRGVPRLRTGCGRCLRLATCHRPVAVVGCRPPPVACCRHGRARAPGRRLPPLLSAGVSCSCRPSLLPPELRLPSAAGIALQLRR